MRQSSRAPRARARVELETGGNPDARGPDLPKSRASGSRTPATRPPTPSHPAEARTELRRPSRGNSGSMRRCRMRACSWAVREAHGPFEGRRHTHTPAARSSRWVSYTTRGSSMHSSRETDNTCEGTGGASVGGARRTGRRGASARHSAVRWVCRHGVWGRSGDRAGKNGACLTRG